MLTSKSIPEMVTIKPTDKDIDAVFLSGWKSPEHDFIWAVGPVNIIALPLGQGSLYRGRNLKISIEINVPLTFSNPSGSRLTFRLGDTELLDQCVSGRTRIVLHAHAATTEPRLSILHITNHEPGNIDGMALGFQLYWIGIEEVPVLRQGELIKFGRGSHSTCLLGPGWKEPEEGFCWSIGRESQLSLFIEPEECRQDNYEGVRVAELMMSLIFHDRADPTLRHWHVLDVMSAQLLLQRQIYPSQGSQIVPIRVFVPLRQDPILWLQFIDHAAASPAQLGNDLNDNAVLGFQLLSLELIRFLTLPCPGMAKLADLFMPDSPLTLGSWDRAIYG